MADNKDKLTLDELAAEYGYAAAFFFSDAELKRLIGQATKEQWTTAKFQAKFMATNWYRTRSADTRTWLELKSRDPAEYAERRRQRWGQVRTMAAQMGVTLSTDQVANITDHSLMLGWDDTILTQAVGAEFMRQGGDTQGQAATTETFIRQTAGDYGVTISDQQIRQMVGQTLSGQITEDHVTDYMKDTAKSKYPGLSAYLDQGYSVRQVAEPYVQSYAQILETSPDTVQMTDSRIQRALQGVAPDPKGGTPQAQSLYDFERDLRKDPRWRKTKNARDSMTNTALGVLRDMGIYS